ncbi:Uncharacterized protein QTN25_005476 [Entamoeba marina]
MLFLVLFITCCFGSKLYDFDNYYDDDILGFDNVSYKSRSDAEKALHSHRVKEQKIQSGINKKLKALQKKYNDISLSSQEKRNCRNQQRKLLRKLRQSRLILLNYEELVKQFF